MARWAVAAEARPLCRKGAEAMRTESEGRLVRQIWIYRDRSPDGVPSGGCTDATQENESCSLAHGLIYLSATWRCGAHGQNASERNRARQFEHTPISDPVQTDDHGPGAFGTPVVPALASALASLARSHHSCLSGLSLRSFSRCSRRQQLATQLSKSSTVFGGQATPPHRLRTKELFCSLLPVPRTLQLPHSENSSQHGPTACWLAPARATKWLCRPASTGIQNTCRVPR
jgi:hypothetical protein